MTNTRKRAYTLTEKRGQLTVTLTLEGVDVGGGQAPNTPEDRAFLVQFAEAWVADEEAADADS